MDPIIITDEGKRLTAGAISGEEPIKFTRICTYNSAGGVKKIMQSADVSGIVKHENRSEIYAVIDNSEIREGYSINGLGLFAEYDGGEILFGYCEENSDAFYIPACSQTSRTEVTLRINIASEFTENVTLNFDSGAYVSARQLASEISRLDSLIRAQTEESIADLNDRLEVVETVLQNGSMENSTVLTFSNLKGISFNGIWNNTEKRIEF